MNDLTSFEATIEAGRRRRGEVQRQRARLALGLPIAILVVWTTYVTIAGHWERVLDQWVSAVTMVFGSFVAGSTPQGGGAVAFPVFTKLLEIDTPVARSFSLSIQAIGMGTAAATIIIARRRVEWRAVATALPAALVTFTAAALLVGRSDEPFWPPRLPGDYVKITFTLLIAAMAVVVYLGYRVHLLERLVAMPIAGPRVIAALVITGIVGGLTSWLVGSGADVALYLTLVVLVGVSPRVGVPTSVIVMAGVSVLGFVMLGVLDGQLSIGLDDAGRVVEVGEEPVGRAPDGTVRFGPGEPLDPDRYDLFGLWLAAVPVVGFGAPLGAWAVSKVTDRQLVRFVVALATAETVTTILFLDGLIRDPDPALIAYSIVGAVVVIGGLWLLVRNRRRILGLPNVDLDRVFTRSRLDAGPRYREQLARPPQADEPAAVEEDSERHADEDRKDADEADATEPAAGGPDAAEEEVQDPTPPEMRDDGADETPEAGPDTGEEP